MFTRALLCFFLLLLVVACKDSSVTFGGLDDEEDPFLDLPVQEEFVEFSETVETSCIKAGYEECNGMDDDCDGETDNVPESMLAGDILNCGKCFKSCLLLPDVESVACKQGNCVIHICKEGYVDDDKSPDNGCEKFPYNKISVIDFLKGENAYGISVAVPEDGLPVISYILNGALRVTKCGDPYCSSKNKSSIVDSASFFSEITSIKINPEGFPVIAYFDFINAWIKFTKCGDTACSTGNKTNIVDFAMDTGGWVSTAIGGDGFPIISYNDNNDNDLIVAKCHDALCTKTQISVVNKEDYVERESSIAVIKKDGLPVIVYREGTQKNRLKVVKCGDPACSGENITSLVDTGGEAGLFSSISLGEDGFPVIALNDINTSVLRQKSLYF